MKRLDGITDSMDMSLGKLQDIAKDREASFASVHGISELDTIYRLIDNNNKEWKCTNRYITQSRYMEKIFCIRIIGLASYYCKASLMHLCSSSQTLVCLRITKRAC